MHIKLKVIKIWDGKNGQYSIHSIDVYVGWGADMRRFLLLLLIALGYYQLVRRNRRILDIRTGQI